MSSKLAEFYHRYKIIIWPVIVGICSLVVVLAIVVPQLMSYTQVNSELNTTKDRLNRLQAKVQQLQSLDQSAYQQGLQLALTALPTDKEVPQSLTLLQAAINQSGLSIEGLKFATTNSNTPQGSFQLTVTVTGSLDGLRQLLVAIQRAPRIFKLNTITAQAIKGQNSVEAEVSLDVYYQALNSNLGTIDQPVPQLDAKDQQLLNDLLARSQTGVATSSATFVPLGKADPFN